MPLSNNNNSIRGSPTRPHVATTERQTVVAQGHLRLLAYLPATAPSRHRDVTPESFSSAGSSPGNRSKSSPGRRPTAAKPPPPPAPSGVDVEQRQRNGRPYCRNPDCHRPLGHYVWQCYRLLGKPDHASRGRYRNHKNHKRANDDTAVSSTKTKGSATGNSSDDE